MGRPDDADRTPDASGETPHASGNTAHASGGGEQLQLDLGLGPRSRDRRRRDPAGRPAITVVRLIVAAALAAVIAATAVVIWPYRTTVAGVGVTVTASVVPSERGITVDSSLGALQFRDVTAVPIGLHVAPSVDLNTVRAVTSRGDDFATAARDDLRARLPGLILHFAGAALLGLLIGALLGRILVDGVVAAFGLGSVRRATRARTAAGAGIQGVAVAVVVAVVLAAVGVITYRSNWVQRYTVTGLLADIAATPERLAALDARDSSAAAKIRAVLRLQDALTQPAQSATNADTAYTILFISDVHRRNIYPYLQQYIEANNVALIVNTGDETLVGQSAELTSDYVASISAITADTPMIWIKGNHDSAAVARAMDDIPGVTVLDDQIVTADGLQIYGTADPRTYGASGAAGSDDPDTVTRIETEAAAAALDRLNRSTYLDLLMAHEPVEAQAMATTLGPTVRATASGHVHRQNPEDQLQRDGRITLVEGTTGLGGLLADAGDPMSFSIMSVAPNCQYTRIVRYQLADPALPADDRTTSFGENSSFVVHYFDRQKMTGSRTCSTATGIGTPVASSSESPKNLEAWGPDGATVPTATAVSSPAPVSSSDETGDQSVTETSGAASTPSTDAASSP